MPDNNGDVLHTLWHRSTLFPDMPFDLTFNALTGKTSESSWRSSNPFIAASTTHEKAPEPETIQVEIEHTPKPPLDRPRFSLNQIIARDVLDKQWYKLLTHKQRLFVCALFANGFDIAKATKEVVPTIGSITEARAKGKYWYSLPKVRTAIDAIFSYYQENTRVRWEDIVSELQTIAFANIMDFYVVDKRGDPILTLPKTSDPRFAAIAEIYVEETRFGQKSRIKMHDKMSAIDRLMKILQPGANAANEGNVGGTSVVVQNINIIPVPPGQFLPAPVIDQKPIIDVKPQPKLSVVN